MVSRTRKHRVDEEGRECTSCEVYKLWHEFYTGAGVHGKDTRCKECMKGKTQEHNKQPAVQEMERARHIARWEAAHPGQEYARQRGVWQADEHGRECSYDGPGNCGHAYKLWESYNIAGKKRETRCRDCRNMLILLRRFLITADQLLYLREEAPIFGPGLCDLHGGPETMKYGRYAVAEKVCGLSIDHSHDCTQGHPPEKGCPVCIRGLTCRDCNRGVLRQAERWPAIGVRFADYLARRPLLESVP